MGTLKHYVSLNIHTYLLAFSIHIFDKQIIYFRMISIIAGCDLNALVISEKSGGNLAVRSLASVIGLWR